MSFLGCTLKPNKPEKVTVPSSELWHLSQVCLHEPKAGKNYVKVVVKGTTYTVACLEKDKQEHNSVDLFFGPEEVTFVNKGASEVHLLGYLEPKEDGDDEDEAPAPAAAKAASPKAAAAASPKAKAAAAKASPKAAPKAAPTADTEEDDEDEEEESEVEAAPPAKKAASPKAEPKASPKAAPKAEAKKAPAKEEDDNSDMGEEGSESELEGEESEEEAAPPAKKAKVGAKAEAKAVPSPKAKAAAAGPEADYIKALVDYLKKNGATEISKLGSAVKRPQNVPKMKAIFEKNADKFAVSGQSVSAK